MNLDKIRGYRTYIVAALGVLTAWVYYLVGDVSLKEAVEASFGAAGLSALRAGLSNHGKKVSDAINDKVGKIMTVALMMGLLGLMGLMTGCAGLSTGPVTLAYGLPKDGGSIEVTLFPDRFLQTGKRVVPVK